MEDQIEMAWCWCAVGTSCALFYDPNSGWTQCKLASESIQPSPGDCCKDPGSSSCDVIWYLDNPKHLGSFETTGIQNGYQAGAVSFVDLCSQIDAGFLVAFRMQMEGLFHFVVISGYEITPDKNSVSVKDPLNGGVQTSYDEFVSNYLGEGKVTHTFFSKPANKK